MSSPHRLIVGRTLTGKTSIAKVMAEKHTATGGIVIIHDPVSSWSMYEGRDGFYIYDNEFDFLTAVAESRSALVIVDEADLIVSQGQRQNWWLGTRARHLGHSVIFISQRPTMIAPTVRDQCGSLYCFLISADDCKRLSNDNAVNIPATTLRAGEFYDVGMDENTGKVKCEKYRLW